MNEDLKDYLKTLVSDVDVALDDFLPMPGETPDALCDLRWRETSASGSLHRCG
jgi:hypothetical protein